METQGHHQAQQQPVADFSAVDTAPERKACQAQIGIWMVLAFICGVGTLA